MFEYKLSLCNTCLSGTGSPLSDWCSFNQECDSKERPRTPMLTQMIAFVSCNCKMVTRPSHVFCEHASLMQGKPWKIRWVYCNHSAETPIWVLIYVYNHNYNINLLPLRWFKIRMLRKKWIKRFAYKTDVGYLGKCNVKMLMIAWLWKTCSSLNKFANVTVNDIFFTSVELAYNIYNKLRASCLLYQTHLRRR